MKLIMLTVVCALAQDPAAGVSSSARPAAAAVPIAGTGTGGAAVPGDAAVPIAGTGTGSAMGSGVGSATSAATQLNFYLGC